MTLSKTGWVLLLVLSGSNIVAQDTPLEFWFWPKYTLGQKAENYPGPRMEAPVSQFNVIQSESVPLIFHGEEPTERVIDFVKSSQLPKNPFSIEMWLVNHVNQPVGVMATLKNRISGEEPAWLVGVYGRDLVYTLKTEDSHFATMIQHKIKERGWKDYWGHVVATYDGNSMKLYLNGELITEGAVGKRKANDDSMYELEVASYMKNEPYMDLGNQLKMLRIHPRALSKEEIRQRMDKLMSMVTEGKLFPGLFHFTAGPYLNNASQSGISMVWETDRAADFVVEYGKQVPYDKKIVLNTQKIEKEAGGAESTIYKVTLTDLEPETPYFYNIKATARDGTVMQSGPLTFTTAVRESGSYSFAVIGDTEARPHINDRISKMVWEERPNFAVIVGDLTDGGVKDHKFEWNYEYFQGITQLASRVPIFPVPGNGEDDLYWYNQYHVLPENDGYYTFHYGNAQFFMLNSNRPQDFSTEGKQYQWLEEELKKSTATWKFVAHHHAPYSADDDDYGDSWKQKAETGDLAIRKIVPLYEKYKVDMVFFGHLHTYQRTLPIKDNKVSQQNGVIYVQGGGGGGNLEDFAPSRAWFSAKTYRGHHYFTITVHDRELNFKMYDTEGRMKDYLDLKK
ncbi:MAG: hypothetical protein DI538_05735 [Azospira oryzae]|nr:MAG: hypothetical protein DI538_05735 [Azospira oryzae]